MPKKPSLCSICQINAIKIDVSLRIDVKYVKTFLKWLPIDTVDQPIAPHHLL
jgi:hypothetical protein